MQDKANAQVQGNKSKPHQVWFQWAALLLAVLAPFGLYYSLNAGEVALAIVSFVFIVISMSLTAWKG